MPSGQPPLSPATIPALCPTQPTPLGYDSQGLYRRCGRSGLLLPAISLGLWHNFGGAGTDAGHHNDDASLHENCRQMLFTAFDCGITHFDLANNYGPPPGSAEERFGRILTDDLRRYRDELIISTKAGYRMWPGPYGEWGSRKYLLASLDASLQRMKLDYVDIFYSHRPDPEHAAGRNDGCPGPGRPQRQGHLRRHLQLSRRHDRRGRSASVARTALPRPSSTSPTTTCSTAGSKGDLLAGHRAPGLGVHLPSALWLKACSPTNTSSGIPEDSRAKSKGGFLKPDAITDDKVAKIRKLNDIAQKRGQSLAQMALAWVLRHQGVTSALIGASRPQQIKDNVAALKAAPFSADELKEIEAALK